MLQLPIQRHRIGSYDGDDVFMLCGTESGINALMYVTRLSSIMTSRHPGIYDRVRRLLIKVIGRR